MPSESAASDDAVIVPLSTLAFVLDECGESEEFGEHRSCLPPCPWGVLHAAVEEARRAK